MPKWLQAWLAFTLGTFWALVGWGAITYAVANGEPDISKDDRIQMLVAYPGGKFIDAKTYEVCDNGTWLHINARWDRIYTNRLCAKRP